MSMLGQAAAVGFWIGLAWLVLHEHHAQVMRDRADARELARARAARRALARATRPR